MAKKNLKTAARRGLSMFLALVMCLSLLNIGVFAANVDDDPNTPKPGEIVNANDKFDRHEDGKLEMKKTITKGEDLNDFNITLTVKTKDGVTIAPVSQTVHAVLVIDKSGSMKDDNKLTNAKNAAKEFVKALFGEDASPANKVAVVAYSSSAETVAGLTGIDQKDELLGSSASTGSRKPGGPGGPGGSGNSQGKIDQITANGGTNIQAGIRKANEILAGDNAGANVKKVIIVLSDGEPTYSYNVIGTADWTDCEFGSYGGDHKWKDPEDHLTNITITGYGNKTVGYGDEYGYDDDAEAKLTVSCPHEESKTITVDEFEHNNGDPAIWEANQGKGSAEFFAVYLGSPSDNAVHTMQGIASKSENYMSASATDSNALVNKFKDIVQSVITTDATAVTDPMGQYIILGDVSNLAQYGVEKRADGNLYWDVTQMNVEPDDDGWKTYTITYPITLDVEAKGFTPDTAIDTNGTTTLRYFIDGEERFEDFTVPTVKGYPLPVYTVTYVDGVEDEVIFEDEKHESIKAGKDTPAFEGTTYRPGYEFDGWVNSAGEKIADPTTVKVLKNEVYTAQWKEETNWLKVEKTLADDQADKVIVGAEVKWNIVITSTSNMDRVVTVDDQLEGAVVSGLTEGKVTIPAAESKDEPSVVTLTVTYKTSDKDIGELTNTVVVDETPSTSEKVEVTEEPFVAATKVPDGAKHADGGDVKDDEKFVAGDTLYWIVNIKNTFAEAKEVEVEELLDGAVIDGVTDGKVTVSANSEVNLTASYVIKESDIGSTIVNKVKVDGKDVESKPIEVPDSGDFLVSKQVLGLFTADGQKIYRDYAKSGEVIQWVIEIENNTLSSKTVEYIQDKIVDEEDNLVAFLSDFTYEGTENAAEFPLTVAKGEKVRLVVSYEVQESDANHSLTNTISVKRSDKETPYDKESEEVQVEPRASKLEVIKTANKTENIEIGDTVTYTITVKNDGDAKATNVEITDVLDEALEFVEATGIANYEFIKETNTVIAKLDELGVSGRAELTITVKVTASGEIKNVASVKSDETETPSTGEETIEVNSKKYAIFFDAGEHGTLNVNQGETLRYRWQNNEGGVYDWRSTSYADPYKDVAGVGADHANQVMYFFTADELEKLNPSAFTPANPTAAAGFLLASPVYPSFDSFQLTAEYLDAHTTREENGVYVMTFTAQYEIDPGNGAVTVRYTNEQGATLLASYSASGRIGTEYTISDENLPAEISANGLTYRFVRASDANGAVTSYSGSFAQGERIITRVYAPVSREVELVKRYNVNALPENFTVTIQDTYVGTIERNPILLTVNSAAAGTDGDWNTLTWNVSLPIGHGYQVSEGGADVTGYTNALTIARENAGNNAPVAMNDGVLSETTVETLTTVTLTNTYTANGGSTTTPGGSDDGDDDGDPSAPTIYPSTSTPSTPTAPTAPTTEIAPQPTPMAPAPSDGGITDIGGVDVPLAGVPEVDAPTVQVPEVGVPMAEVPETGDALNMWILAAAISGIGLVWLTLTGRKQEGAE